MKIYINVRDTASDFNNEVNIVGMAVTFEGALKTHKSEVEKGRKLANEMGYDKSVREPTASAVG